MYIDLFDTILRARTVEALSADARGKFLAVMPDSRPPLGLGLASLQNKAPGALPFFFLVVHSGRALSSTN